MRIFKEFSIRQLMKLAPKSLRHISVTLRIDGKPSTKDREQLIYLSVARRSEPDFEGECWAYVDAGVEDYTPENQFEIDSSDHKMVGWILRIGPVEIVLDEDQSGHSDGFALTDLDNIKLFAPNHGFDATYALKPVEFFDIKKEAS